jgi:hypothetical protein
VVGDRRHRHGAVQAEPGSAQRLHRDDLADQRGLHVHDSVAVHVAVDQVAGVRGGRRPAVRDRLGVHVAGQHDALAGAEGQLADRVGPVGEDRLEGGGLETRLAHHLAQEPGQLAFLAQDARNAADLAHQLDQPFGIDGGGQTVAEFFRSQHGRPLVGWLEILDLIGV